MLRILRVLALAGACVQMTAGLAAAGDHDKSFRLFAPDDLMQSGFLKHLLPRFSLKTGVRIELTGDSADAAIATGGTGIAVFQRGDTLWHLDQIGPAHAGVGRFLDWLASDIGRRTIAAYQPDQGPAFAPPQMAAAASVEITFDGDARQGAALSETHCGRCHVVRADRRMNSIGSTPSFFLLRSLPDWAARFQTFYVRRPHPAFSQIEDITQPFAAHLPPPIHPLEITVDDLSAILAYVSGLDPADLGAPLQFQ